MSATNYTPIQLYYSTTASAAPVNTNLANGELAINITDGKLFYKDNGGVVQVIATKGAGTIGGSNTQIQYNNAGALAGNAAMTFNSGTSTVTLTTLNLTNALGATYGGTAQSAYTQGDVLYASAANTLSKLSIGTANYILTSTGSVPQWVAPTSVTVQTANNLAGGAGGSVPYQSAADTTTFLAIGAANRVMTSSGTAPQWMTSLTGLTGVSSSSITNTSLTSGRVVYSSTAGLETDSANLTFNGTTLSTTGVSNTGFSTLVKTLTLGDSSFNGGAVFAAATPAKLYIGTGTVTDVTSAIGATNATGAISSLAITPIAASNTSVTYTNASTLYIAGAPSAGTNITITNPYALYVAAGAAYLGGNLTLNGGTANGVTYLNGSKVLTSGSALTFDGTTLTNTASGSSAIAATGKSVVFYNTSVSDALLRAADDSSTVTAIGFNKTDVKFYSSGSEQMRLTSTGLGIGTSSPSNKLHVNSGASTTNSLFESTGTSLFLGLKNSGAVAYIGSDSAGSFLVQTPGSGFSTKLLVDTSGNVGIGVTPQAKLNVQYTDSAPTSSGTISSGVVLQYSTGGVALNMGTSSSGYSYFNSAFANNAGVGQAYRFYQGATQAMTLTAAGELLVGTTSTNGTLTVQTSAANTNVISGFASNATGINYLLSLQSAASAANSVFIRAFNNTSTLCFNVAGTGNVTNTNNSYGAISDAKLKENITDATPKLDKLNQVRVVNYNLIGETQKQIGVIAQEVEQIFPSMVDESPDRDAEGNDLGTTTKAVKYSVFVPMLIKALQEQQAIIDSLKSRLDAANL